MYPLGMHSNPSAEISLNSQSRHRLTGWNAVKSRVEQLQLELTDEQVSMLSHHIICMLILPQIKDATAKIKELADVRPQSMEDVDTVLRVYHTGIKSGELVVGESKIFDKLLSRHRESSASPMGRTPQPVDAVA